jgi:alpha-methylacyl-CoA racemase
MAGPLAGIRIVEFAGLGPGPFAAMMLADHGAEVIRIERPGAVADPADPAARSRRSVTLDIRTEAGAAAARALCKTADGLIEGFRPGVMERLGLGPEVLLAANPKLVYGRMTGWGQDGPLAHAAGHDINYIAISGLLHTVGRAGEKPVPPINYAGDFGGGGMLLAFGMAAALVAVKMGGPGQVVDAAMTEGSSLLAGMLRWLGATGRWRDERGVNLLDGGAHFYDTYETADGKYVAIGAIEPQFYNLLLETLELADDPAFRVQLNPATWPALTARLAAIFRTKTRAEWCALMEGTDICFAPVLSLGEAPHHPHNVARGAFVEVGGMVQPAPAPRYSATPNDPPRPPGPAGADNAALLAFEPGSQA